MKSQVIFLSLAVVLVLLIVAACAPAAATTAPAAGDGDGKALLQERCTVCHGLGMVTRDRFNAAGWKLVVDDMIGRGANLSPSEETILIDYLTKTYGK